MAHEKPKAVASDADIDEVEAWLSTYPNDDDFLDGDGGPTKATFLRVVARARRCVVIPRLA